MASPHQLKVIRVKKTKNRLARYSHPGILWHLSWVSSGHTWEPRWLIFIQTGASAAPLSEPSRGGNPCNKGSGGHGGGSQLAGCSHADIHSSPTKVVTPTDQHTQLCRREGKGLVAAPRKRNSNICLSVLKRESERWGYTLQIWIRRRQNVYPTFSCIRLEIRGPGSRIWRMVQILMENTHFSNSMEFEHRGKNTRYFPSPTP